MEEETVATAPSRQAIVHVIVFVMDRGARGQTHVQVIIVSPFMIVVMAVVLQEGTLGITK